ncbi:hypothetical protein VaNZ11_002490 [Volvox africanus]|uniref:FHA domain-containing protein n=1 Tax=Volvox africanus TaxID=51714 RepID=A0ABQ5RS38_9CHLO|nr:hypothetical protein VaNZ11_002490 [Volvox africanus]
MELIFKCRTSIRLPRDGSQLSLGRGKPVLSWDNALISRNHMKLHVEQDRDVLVLSVIGRNAIVVERQAKEGDGWDVITVVDPGASTLLPLGGISDNHATRFFVLGAMERSAVELRLAAAAAAVTTSTAATATATAEQVASPNNVSTMGGELRPQPPVPQPLAKRQRVSTGGGHHPDAPPAASAAALGKSTPPPYPGLGSGASAEAPAGASPSPAGRRTGTAAAAAVAGAAASTEAAVVPCFPGPIKSSGRAPGAATSTAAAISPHARGGQDERTRGTSSAVGAPQGAVPYDIESPVHLLRVRGLSPRYNSGCLGADLRRLVSGGPMQLALVSNYMVDVPWLLTFLPDLVEARQLFIVHGEGPEADAEMRHQVAAAGAPHAQLHRPPLPIMYGTHHSKAFLLTYPHGLRLIIHTANCVQPDCNDKTQALWVQDFPRKAAAVTPLATSMFERDLVVYCRALALPPSMERPVLDAIAAHDFSHARGVLVTSVPGYHRGATAVHSYGHMRLRRLLEQVPLPAGFAGSSSGNAAESRAAAADRSAVPSEGLVIQCSSMGSFDQAWLVDELGASLAAHQRTAQQQSASRPRPSGPPGCGPLPLAVVWPTVTEVRNSLEGWNAGRSIPAPARNAMKPFMGRYYARWGGEVVGRQRAMPHIKTYTRYRGQQLAWFLLASHNLSKAAWGDLQKNGTQLMIRSYELGVLVTPALEAAYRASPQYGFCCHPSPNSLQMEPRHRPQQQQQQQPSESTQMKDTSPSQVLCITVTGVTFCSFAAPTTCALPGITLPSYAGDERSGDDGGGVTCMIPVPYTLPPTSYHAGEDKPWVVDVPQQGLDALGLPWGAPYSHYGHIDQPD